MHPADQLITVIGRIYRSGMIFIQKTNKRLLYF